MRRRVHSARCIVDGIGFTPAGVELVYRCSAVNGGGDRTHRISDDQYTVGCELRMRVAALRSRSPDVESALLSRMSMSGVLISRSRKNVSERFSSEFSPVWTSICSAC